MSFESVNSIKTEVVKRIQTGLTEIDFLYGMTYVDGEYFWGIPEKTISLWAGERGIGKSRLAVEVARKVSRRGFSVMYFQNEMTKGTFATKIKSDGGNLPSWFYISDTNTLDGQIEEIRRSRAQLVVVDSISMLEGFRAGSVKSIVEVMKAFRQVCQVNNCHIVLLSQLTKTGDARGSTVLPHLVDVEFKLTSAGPERFWFKLDGKNRYGSTGNNHLSCWLHFDTGLKCFSDYSRYDETWCKSHGLELVDPIAEARKDAVALTEEIERDAQEYGDNLEDELTLRYYELIHPLKSAFLPPPRSSPRLMKKWLFRFWWQKQKKLDFS
jgi:predicted ATP-dependent serine protease